MADDRPPRTRAAASAADAQRLDSAAAAVADDFIHRLAPAFRPPARLICPSDAAEQAVVAAVTRAATARGIPSEVIDLRSASADRLEAVTARLDGWRSVALDDARGNVPTLLILCGFDVFGGDDHDAPTYPFRSKFQFDQKFLWLFIGRDWRRMAWLFGSTRRPLYQAAGDITPPAWRAPAKHAAHTALPALSKAEKDGRTRQRLADVDAGRIMSAEKGTPPDKDPKR